LSWQLPPPLLRLYPLLPHALLNRAMGALSRARHPRPLVQAALRAWIRRDAIDLAEFEPGPFATLEELFLRRLRPGARPIGPGIVSPVDGRVVAHGEIAPGAALRVKGRPLSLERLVGGADHPADLTGFHGGAWISIFLSPRGYHRIHMPEPGTIAEVRFIPGRFFPQNELALAHLDRVWERNERATLRIRRDAGGEALLVLVGASLVGGIELAGVPRATWVARRPVALGLRREKGGEIAHFRFGSTVVLLLPPGAPALRPLPGDELRMGEPLCASPLPSFQ
jgi:phosphatidylserine decarboxylase